MQRVLMCRPNHFGVTYDINPWMTNQQGRVDKIKAITQWHLLRDWISNHASVLVLDGVEDMPDLVFTANAGLVLGNKFVLSRFEKSQRQPEETVFREIFEENGYEIFQPQLSYEGQGDHLIDGQNRHWMGTGFRTNNKVKSEIEQFLDTEITTLELIDPRWYHLDTCFCPLPGGEIMWYPGAFSKTSQAKISSSFSRGVEVQEQDALKFSCNAVCLGRQIFLPENLGASNSLRKLGYVTHELDLSEFMKAGGAAKCLVLHLEDK